MQKITIDPISRIEGHLKAEVVVDGGTVKEANVSGTLFRGFENILSQRDPRDAVIITQRVCGVCPICHATASATAVDAALGIDAQVPDNGRITRNIILGANYLQSHILHFYILAALDFVDVTAAADYAGDDLDLRTLKDFIAHGELGPFVPRYEGDYRLSKEQNILCTKHYLEALRARRTCHELLAVFGGKMPHNCGIVPGGVSTDVSADKVVTGLGKIQQIRQFVEECYVPDVLAVAGVYSDYFGIGAGCGTLLSYGVFDLESKAGGPPERTRFLPQGITSNGGPAEPVDMTKIAENVKHSWYMNQTKPTFLDARTVSAPGKQGAYSWLKAPRYDDKAAEVGPLARVMVAYKQGDKRIKSEVNGVASAAGIGLDKCYSVLGRHAARAIEAKVLCDAMSDWMLALKPGEPVSAPLVIPNEGEGIGFTEGPRGALCHAIRIKNKVIENYQLVVPTTWNASPKDANDQPGPIEQALIGCPVKDPANPFEVVRVIRSFDPCLACAVHVMDGRGRELGVYRIA
ncbi:MAG: nickel-dependent hydrogenase large subunit [Planctomycetota bacterium]